VPEAKPDDPEDVSWALSTAEAMWARGDHMEGIKWVRRAAEAASEAENDRRSLELAKAAADLAGLIARRSKIESDAALPPAPASSSPSKRAISNQPPSNAPSTARSAAPPAPSPKSMPPKPRSAPPIPLPSKASKPPSAPEPPRAAVASSQRPGPAPGKGILSNRPAPEQKKGKRRSRENLDAESKAAAQLVQNASKPPALERPYDSSRAVKPAMDSDATVVGRIEDVLAKTDEQRERSAEEWDASPTANLVGDEMPPQSARTQVQEVERKTHVGQAPPPPRPPTPTLHDPQIQTSQAIRVVVWRDASGVHIAPAGTVVSALTIDAVLVALDPTADLTAWLSHRER